MQTGDRFQTNKYGELEIVEYFNAYRVTVRFIETGYMTDARADAIRNGHVKDKLSPSVYGVGYVGDGEHKIWVNGKQTKAYSAWASMLQRCYDPKLHMRCPTYAECTVVDAWHNFQVFAEWCEANYVDGYELDKDKLIKGNKIYAPENCVFLSPAENTAVSKAHDFAFISPYNVLHKGNNIAAFARQHGLDDGNLIKVKNGKYKHHKGWKLA